MSKGVSESGQRPDLRQRLDRELESHPPDGKMRTGNRIIVALILLSAIIFALDSDTSINPAFAGIVGLANLVILLAFAAEFVLRLWSAGTSSGARTFKERVQHAGPVWLAIDFIAFAPELLVLLFLWLSGGHDNGLVEALKIIRLLRLAKLAHFLPGGRVLMETLESVRTELVASAIAACVLIYCAAVVIYVAEGPANPENFGSVGQSLWWSVITLTTVGYGDVYPESAVGKLVAGFLALVGVGLVALPSGIVAGAFVAKVRERRSNRDLQD